MLQPKSSVDVLRIHHLRIWFPSAGKWVRAIDEISLSMPVASSFALMGESGCGKTVLATAIFGLLPRGTFVQGEISAFGWKHLLDLSQRKLHRLRGSRMVLIPQNPHGSLHPMFRIETQIRQTLQSQNPSLLKQAHHVVTEILEQVGFPDPQKIAGMYPHELSGGMAQRVLVAIASGMHTAPDLIVADEPTKGVDADVREHIVSMMLQRFPESAILLITHDPWVASQCRQLAVMYAGEWVETGDCREILELPLHPYTKGLLAAHPRNGLHPIPGVAPESTALPKGCRFHPRCPIATIRCRTEHPKLMPIDNRMVRCFHARG